MNPDRRPHPRVRRLDPDADRGGAAKNIEAPADYRALANGEPPARHARSSA